MVSDEMEVRVGEDLIHWSAPVLVEWKGKAFGNHYVAVVADDAISPPQMIIGDRFSFLTNHNGTDVTRFTASFRK